MRQTTTAPPAHRHRGPEACTTAVLSAPGDGAGRPVSGPRPGQRDGVPHWTAERLRTFRASQQRLRSLLARKVARIFPGLTGLSFRLVRPGPFSRPEETVGHGSQRRRPRPSRRGVAGPAPPGECPRSHPEPQQRSTGPADQQLRGRPEPTTLRVRLRVAGMEIGEVLLQAAAGPPAAGGAGPDFDRAVGLLRLLLANLSAELKIRQLRLDLHGAQESVRQLRTEFGRLRHGIHAPLPPVTMRGQAKAATPASQHLVDQMLAYAHEHYHRPMGLKEVAQALGRNASYLSTLFSHRTGLAFHAYLDEFRLAKAKELLHDRTRSIAQVAGEAGYASDDWFRHAFKAHTGLSPSAWRQLEA